MYKNLKGEMIKKDLSAAKLAGLIKVSEKTLRNKINGEINVTRPEVSRIHRLVNPNMSKEELFDEDKKENICSIA